MSASDLAELRTAHDTEGFFFIDEHEPIQVSRASFYGNIF